MDIIILLTKEDINTHVIGNHIDIKANGVTINLTKDAAIELKNDIELALKQIEK